METLGHIAPVGRFTGERIDGQHRAPVHESIAEEVPVTFVYNGVSHAVMLASPSDLEDFAIGFSLTEGLIGDANSISRIQVVRYSRGIELQMETLTPVNTGEHKRRLAGRTGCGLCGIDDVDRVFANLPHVDSRLGIHATSISRAMHALRDHQPLNLETGAVHAAAFANVNGELLLVREDVGRHNALDKLIGALQRHTVNAHSGFVVVTSRGSFELVQKCAVLGTPVLACVSAPTGLAIRIARDIGLTLAGFARDDRMTVYATPERIEVT